VKFTPLPFQLPAIEHADCFLDGAAPDARQGYTSPTGSGKSIMELCLQERRLAKGKNHWIITPKDEIIVGMLEKLGVKDPESVDCFDYRISTPIRLRNAIMRGDILPPEELTRGSSSTYCPASRLPPPGRPRTSAATREARPSSASTGASLRW
jgi:hypothetical protein